MDDMKVELPYQHIVRLAKSLGSQEIAACPPDQMVCWRHRALDPYLKGDPVENECTECWLRFIINGD